jgi:small subunit ribosomal protein S1
LSWTVRFKHPSEYQKGDDVEAVVLSIEVDDERPKVSLGIKKLVPDPWNRIPYDPMGRIVDVKVIKVLDFGVFVELERGVEGLIHISEISYQRVDDPRKFVKPGQTLRAQVITLDSSERKIGLSLRSAVSAEKGADAQGFIGVAPTATLGDVYREKLTAIAQQTRKN